MIAGIQSLALACWMARWFTTSRKTAVTQTTTSIVALIALMRFGLTTDGTYIVHSANNASLHAGGWQKGYVNGWKSGIL